MNFDVIQCGSSIRTSLCEGESYDKYTYILYLQDTPAISRIKFSTVRTLILENMKISTSEKDFVENHVKESFTNLTKDSVNKIIENINVKSFDNHEIVDNEDFDTKIVRDTFKISILTHTHDEIFKSFLFLKSPVTNA